MHKVIHTPEGELRYEDPFIERGTAFTLVKEDRASGLGDYYVGMKFVVDKTAIEFTQRRRKDTRVSDDFVYGYNSDFGHLYFSPSCIKVIE